MAISNNDYWHPSNFQNFGIPCKAKVAPPPPAPAPGPIQAHSIKASAPVAVQSVKAIQPSYTPAAGRPAKTVDVIRRMICHDLGIKVPKKTTEERARDKFIRDQVHEQVCMEREAKKLAEQARKEVEYFESLKRWLWENEKW
jgi:hypothetical protein